MKKLSFTTAVQIIILLYLVLTSTSIHAKSSIHNLYSVDSLYKGYKINHNAIKAMTKLPIDQLEMINGKELKKSVNISDSKIAIGLNTQLYTNELTDIKNTVCKNINKNSIDVFKRS